MMMMNIKLFVQCRVRCEGASGCARTIEF